MPKSVRETIRVLAADDEESILKAYRACLSQLGGEADLSSRMEEMENQLFGSAASDASGPVFDLKLCRSGREAVEEVKNASSEEKGFAVAFIDVRMPPGPDGIAAAEQIRKLDPNIEIVIVTAYSDYDPAQIARRVPPVDKLLYVQKPFHPHEIKHFTQALGAKWRLAGELREARANTEFQLSELSLKFVTEINERKKIEEKLKESVEKLKKALEGAIHAMSQTVEARDPYTAGHQKRVAALSTAIASAMGFSDERLSGLGLAASIHDLGKISVPAEILSKPSRLTRSEFELIMTHPRTGHCILKEIDFEVPIAQIVLQHHERNNGSGYPDGLTGKDILLEAKIIAVADVVEAMSSHRPYRPALGIEAAMAEIESNRGVLYEPDVVDCCLRLLKDKKFTF